jgi:hypothetical protein
MAQPIFVKLTVHPELQRFTTERRECEAIPGMMWVARALHKRDGMLRVHMCVKCTCLLFGRRATISVVVGTMFNAGALVVRK